MILVKSSDPLPVVAEAGVIILFRGGVILVRPLSGKDEWLLPKGHLEGQESHLEAAVREAKEETGATITIEDSSPVGETTLETPLEIQKIKWFVGRGSHIRTEDMKDSRELGVFPPIAALALLTYIDQRKILAKVLAGE